MCDIKTLSTGRILNMEHFYGKIMQKMCTKSPRPLFNFAKLHASNSFENKIF